MKWAEPADKPSLWNVLIGLQTQVKKSRQAGGSSVSAAAANDRNFTGETVTVPRGGRLYCVLFAGLYWNTAAGHWRRSARLFFLKLQIPVKLTFSDIPACFCELPGRTAMLTLCLVLMLSTASVFSESVSSFSSEQLNFKNSCISVSAALSCWG